MCGLILSLDEYMTQSATEMIADIRNFIAAKYWFDKIVHKHVIDVA